MSMRITQRRQGVFYFLTLTLSAYFWIFIKGPFIDTSFELNLLQQSASFGDYVELIKLDNQPPGQKLFTYFMFILTNNSMNLTRFFTTLLLGGFIYLVYRWYAIASEAKPGNYAFLFFLVIVCVGPTVMSALTIQRYSTSITVIWCATILVAIVAVRKQRASLAVMSGFLTSVAFFVSYTSIVLAFMVFVFILWVDRGQLLGYLIGCIPGIIASFTWFIIAGPTHQDLVFAKGAMPVSRQVGALWENTFWFSFGPASLPSLYFALLLALVLTSLTVVRGILHLGDKTEVIFLAVQFLFPIIVFSYAGLANANMAGPCLAILIYIVAQRKFSFEQKLITQISLGYLFVLPAIASVFIFTNFNVLRPYYWSNASIGVVDDLKAFAQNRSLTVYSLGDMNLKTQTHDSQDVRLIDVRESAQGLGIGSYFIFSDEIDKSKELADFIRELDARNLQLQLVKAYGRFTQMSSRKLLGMYNLDGSQYSLYQVISRSK